MNLTSCPACKKQVSKSAFDCPHCGHPFKDKPADTYYRILLWGVAILVGLPLLLIIMFMAFVASR